jgi:hypothetical protein
MDADYEPPHPALTLGNIGSGADIDETAIPRRHNPARCQGPHDRDVGRERDRALFVGGSDEPEQVVGGDPVHGGITHERRNAGANWPASPGRLHTPLDRLLIDHSPAALSSTCDLPLFMGVVPAVDGARSPDRRAPTRKRGEVSGHQWGVSRRRGQLGVP